jgi:hypothetical protein
VVGDGGRPTLHEAAAQQKRVLVCCRDPVFEQLQRLLRVAFRGTQDSGEQYVHDAAPGVGQLVIAAVAELVGGGFDGVGRNFVANPCQAAGRVPSASATTRAPSSVRQTRSPTTSRNGAARPQLTVSTSVHLGLGGPPPDGREYFVRFYCNYANAGHHRYPSWSTPQTGSTFHEPRSRQHMRYAMWFRIGRPVGFLPLPW